MTKHIAWLITGMLAVAAAGASPAAAAADVDFSCMSYKVWGKGHVSNQFMSYDIVIQNDCPGNVYWAMCIERLDQETQAVVETHNPAGYVEVGKKARVNLHLKKQPGKNVFHNRFQEFYLDVGYAIEPPARAQCLAAACEAKKRGIRNEIRANETAWRQAEQQIDRKIDNDCPNSGWDKDSYQKCSAEVRETNQYELEGYVLKDQELRQRLAEVDPEQCTVYSGELADH
jgi:hypothetical protein